MKKKVADPKFKIFNYPKAFPVRGETGREIYFEAKQILCKSISDFKGFSGRPESHLAETEPFIFDAFVYEIGKCLVSRRKIEQKIAVFKRESGVFSEEELRKLTANFFDEVSLSVKLLQKWGASQAALSKALSEIQTNPGVDVFRLYKMQKVGFVELFDGEEFIPFMIPGRLINGPAKMMAFTMVELLRGLAGENCGPNKYVVDIYKNCRKLFSDDNNSEPWGDTKKIGKGRKNWLDELKQILKGFEPRQYRALGVVENSYEPILSRISARDLTPAMKRYQSKVKKVLARADKNLKDFPWKSSRNEEMELAALQEFWEMREHQIFWEDS